MVQILKIQRKNTYITFIFPAVFIGGLFYFSPTSPALAEAATSCKSLMENKCLDCHFETRICRKITKNKGTRSWKRTIKSMIRHGAEVNGDEQKALISCFVDKDKEILSFCGMDK